MATKYWFILKPSVFVWRKKEKCLFYDSSTFIYEELVLEDIETAKILEQIMNINNLNCILFDSRKIETFHSDHIINKLIYLKMSKLVLQEQGIRKPIQLPPLLNLQADVQRLQKTNITDKTIGENVTNNLKSVLFDFSKSKNDFDINSFAAFLAQLKPYNVEIVIQNNSTLLDLKNLFWKQLQNMSHIKFVFNIDCLNINKVVNTIISIFKKCNYEFIIKSENDNRLLKETIKYLPKETTVNYHFHIFSKRDFELAEESINKFQLSNYKFTPCYNGENLTFFKKHVYIDKDDILKSRQTKQNIFAHQVLNTNDFGKLTVNSEGLVYANIHYKPLGTINNDIRYLVYKEMLEGTSWRRVRNTKPCSSCLYQWLCPSPSDYELEIKKTNLCHIEP